jgi:glycosyltransferase involved in cell wall biosynthesis
LSGENREKSIILFGGYHLPNKNASSHRGVNIAKAFRALNYRVVILGNTYDSKVLKAKKLPFREQDIQLYAIKYPSNFIQWIPHYCFSGRHMLPLKRNPETKVILYNATIPNVIITLLFFKRRNIILDNTELFKLTENVTLIKIIKYVDCLIRERISKKLIPNSINISTYLDSKKSKNSIIIPPLIDKKDSKWQETAQKPIEDNRITLIYAGDIGDSKDNLEEVIQFLGNQKNQNLSLNIAGITKEAFIAKYGSSILTHSIYSINFFGRVSHEEVIALTKKADYCIFIRPNNLVTKAGFPTKFVESLACGTPVITNLTSDIHDHIEKIKGCIIVKKPYVISPLKRKSKSTSKACQTYAFQNFHYENFISQIKRLL